jgi:hypothetical protein
VTRPSAIAPKTIPNGKNVIYPPKSGTVMEYAVPPLNGAVKFYKIKPGLIVWIHRVPLLNHPEARFFFSFNFGGVELKEAMQLDTDKAYFLLLLQEIRGNVLFYLKRFRYAYEVVRSRNV